VSASLSSLCLLFTVFGFVTSGILPGQVRKNNVQQSVSPEDLYSQNKSSVVTILTFDRNKAPLEQGSGFVVGKNRIATNYHVIKGSASASIVFDDGTMMPVDLLVVGSPQKDLAIIEAATGNRRPLNLGDERSLKVGTNIYAIGAPQGLSSSLSNGLVSGFREDEGQFLIQVTASISPGSSGGPVFDAQGRVVGITTSRLKDGSFSFAVGVGDLQHLLLVPPAPVKLAEIAEKENQSAADSKPGPDDETFESIKDLVRLKKFRESVAALEAIPESARQTYKWQLLECRIRTQVPGWGIAACERAMQLNPASSDPYGLEVYALLRREEWDNAESIAIKGLSVEQTSANRGTLALVYILERKYDLILKTLHPDSSDPTELNFIASAALRLGEDDVFNKANERLKTIRGRETPWGLFVQGLKAKNALDFSLAEEKFNKCAKDEDMWDSACASFLLEMEVMLGEREKAKTDVHVLSHDYLRDRELLAEGIKVSLVIGDREGADSYHSLLGQQDFPEKNFYECLYSYGTNGLSTARSTCDALAADTSVDSEHLRYAAFSALDMGDYDNALDRFSRVNDWWLETKTKHTKAEELVVVWGTTTALHLMGKKKEAKSLYQIIRHEDPDYMTVVSLKTLPFVWSDRTLALISQTMAAYK